MQNAQWGVAETSIMRVQAAKVLWYLTKSKQNVAKCTSQFSTWPTPLFRSGFHVQHSSHEKHAMQSKAAIPLFHTLLCYLFSHIVWQNREWGVYITEERLCLAAGWCSGHLLPKRGQEGVVMGLSVGPLWACRRRVQSKPGVSNGIWSEDRVSWELQRKATREAGNRAAITFRSGQWRDSVPERFVVNNSTG